MYLSVGSIGCSDENLGYEHKMRLTWLKFLKQQTAQKIEM